MTFSNDKPIYIQMADRLCDEILSGVYKDGLFRDERGEEADPESS